MTKIMATLAEKLSAKGALDVREAFIDASFAAAKKGGARSEKRNAARERRSWLWQTVMVFQWPYTLKVLHLTK